MGLFSRSINLEVAQDSGNAGGTGGVPWYYGYSWAGRLPKRAMVHVVFTCATPVDVAAVDGVQPGVSAEVAAGPSDVVLRTNREVGAADAGWASEVARLGGGQRCEALVLGERWMGQHRTEIHVLLVGAQANLNVDPLPPATTRMGLPAEGAARRSSIATAPRVKASAAPPRVPRESTRPAKGKEFDLWGGPGFCNQHVVGESYHKRHLRKLTKGRQPPIECEALLVRQKNNRYDRNAVAIVIGGGLVGHLPRDVAAEYAPAIEALEARGWQARVIAEISWWEDSNDDIAPGVRVRLGPVGSLMPANGVPTGAALVMQWDAPGVRCNDVDAEAVDALIRALGRGYGDIAAYGVIDLVQEGKRKPRAVVTVDGYRIATATPQSTAHLIPLHATAQREGKQLVAPVAINHLPGLSEVTVACSRAKDLSADWFNDRGRGK